MSRRVTLPDPTRGGEVTVEALRRLVGILTATLNDVITRLESTETALTIETDLSRPPGRVGQIAVVGADVYIATGLTPADWTQVN